jgi:hypothetical protein
MSCAICETRKPRRLCPAVRGEICAVCCGASRETTVDCPLDCRYLQEAHTHERVPEPDPEKFPNPDVKITERFAHDTAPLFTFFGHALVKSALSVPGVTDNDLREALDSMARTYRTLQSGLVYQTRPDNPVAGAVQQKLHAELEAARKQLHEQTGMETLRDTDILGVLVMFQRIEYGRNNGRPRGRAFLDFLHREFPGGVPSGPAAPPGGLIVPA